MGDPLATGYTRVFLIEGRARADREPSYESSLKMAGIDYSRGDIEDIKVPDPQTYDRFKTVGKLRGEEERPSTSLSGRYCVDVRSELLRLARIGCAVDVQLHMGTCSIPSIFNEFQKAVVLEDVYLASYSTDELGALGPDERAVVNETVEISAAKIYEVLPVVVSEVGADVVTNEVLDIIIADQVSCGECESYSDGCQKIFAITKAAGGSPSTPADVVFSLDGGATWHAHDIDSMNATDDPSAIAKVQSYIVVVSQDSGSLHYALFSEFDGATDPDFTEVSTGFNASGAPNDIWSIGNMAFIVGEGGYIYKVTDPSAGVTELDSSAAGGDGLNAVHALDDEKAVAVGDNGAVVYTRNGTLWTAASRPVGYGVNLTCVWMRGEDEWWVGTDDGRVFYTLDAGTSWTEKSLPGNLAAIYDICFPFESVGWIAGATSAPAGRILRSYDGGYSWLVIPEGTSVIPANDAVNAIAGCTEDANILAAGGLADDGSDGILLIAQP